MEQAVRTVIFADLTGSTGLFESAGNVAATQIVTRCTHALGRHLACAGGRIVKYLGDGVLVLFDDPVAAVQAASRLQDVLEELAGAELRRAPIGVKTGVALGPIVEHDGDCYGDPVNVAARLSDRAQTGETLIGESVFANLPESLHLATLGSTAAPLGELQLFDEAGQPVASEELVRREWTDPKGRRLVWIKTRR